MPIPVANENSHLTAFAIQRTPVVVVSVVGKTLPRGRRGLRSQAVLFDAVA